MAVQARHLSHAFPAIATDDAAAGGSVFLGDEFSRCAPAGVGVRDTTRLRDFPRSDLTGCGYYHRGIEFEFEPRKRARVDADGFVADQLVPLALPPHQAAVTVQAHHAAGVDDDAGACGAPAPAGGPGGLLLSGLYDLHGAEIDALVRLESERMRAALEDARRRHARALLSAAARAASGRLRAAEAALERARRRNAELEDRARQAAAECHAWMGVARSHEAVAAGLRATLDQLVLQTPCPGGAAAAVAEGDAEDAQSCCFEFDAGGDADGNAAASGSRAAVAASSCRACGGGEACVLLLPCRHLCLCRACEPDADACPVCAAAKNASLHVLLVP